jgi:hypothetical protein
MDREKQKASAKKVVVCAFCIFGCLLCQRFLQQQRSKLSKQIFNLQCLPMKFGTGGVQQIREAVSEAEDFLERGGEMECVVQYKAVL